MTLEQTFAWTNDGLPGWRNLVDSGEALALSDSTPAEAVERALDAGNDPKPILARTASEICDRVSNDETELARDYVMRAEFLLGRGDGPTDEVERLLEKAAHHLDDTRMKLAASMLGHAVRAARAEVVHEDVQIQGVEPGDDGTDYEGFRVHLRNDKGDTAVIEVRVTGSATKSIGGPIEDFVEDAVRDRLQRYEPDGRRLKRLVRDQPHTFSSLHVPR